jgi:hypothetical protein
MYEDKYVLTEMHAAHLLGVPKSRLAALRRAGAGPNYRRFDRFIRYSYSDLSDFIIRKRQADVASDPRNWSVSWTLSGFKFLSPKELAKLPEPSSHIDPTQ